MNISVIKSALYTWLSTTLGDRHVFTINFDVDFVTGNTINGSFDGDAIDPVLFDTDHDTTMLALAAEIQKSDEIFKAVVTDDRELTVVGLLPGDTITVVGPTVTGGASQAVATIADAIEPTSVEVIFMDQVDDTGRNAPRPTSYPYATIRIDNVVQLGHDELREIDDVSYIATIGGQRRATVSVDYFGSQPIANIMDAYNSLEKHSLVEVFKASGFSFLEKTEVQNLTGILETSFEERASFDFFIGFAENIEDDLGAIESVELTANAIPDGETVVAVTVGPTTIGS